MLVIEVSKERRNTTAYEAVFNEVQIKDLDMSDQPDRKAYVYDPTFSTRGTGLETAWR